MIDYISKCSTDMLLKNRTIKKEDYDIYFYGMQIVYSTTLKSIGLILSAYVLGIMVEMIVFLFCFAWLRKYAGGRHTDSYLTCFLSTLALSAIPILIVVNVAALQTIYFIIGSFIIAILLILKYAPVDTPNKPIYEEQRKILHKKSIYLSISLYIIIIILYLLVDDVNMYCIVASTALLIEALTLLPVFNRIKKSEGGNE